MTRTGFIDHVGIGVPDLVAAKEYYDELMSVLGLREWFETVPGGPLNYGPDGARGSQLFFYQAEEPVPTRDARPASTTLRSWLRAERSSGKHTSGRARAGPSSWTSHASSPSTESTASRPIGSTRTGSSSRPSATVPKRADRDTVEPRAAVRHRPAASVSNASVRTRSPAGASRPRAAPVPPM